jgi:hypothetical protein
MAAPPDPVRVAAWGCLTPLGDAVATHQALLSGSVALRLEPVLGAAGGDPVPLALLPEHALDEEFPPRWIGEVGRLLAAGSGEGAAEGWGAPRRPVWVTGSNFGVGGMYAYRRYGEAAHLAWGNPGACADHLRSACGWGDQVAVLSHACVSAHLGLVQAARMLQAGLADEALVLSFDFLSPFVTGGFHALKILNGGFPAPYADRPTGAIGLGDGVGYAVLSRRRGELVLLGQSLHNEMHHVTGNRPDGGGFDHCLAPLAAVAGGRRLWLKGHGTGTLEAGRLEAAAFARNFPGSPLVGWKGSLGHTLGSCGIIELAVAAESLQRGRTPGTVGSAAPTFGDQVALESFDNAAFDGVVCASNAFGGAHAGLILSHA